MTRGRSLGSRLLGWLGVALRFYRDVFCRDPRPERRLHAVRMRSENHRGSGHGDARCKCHTCAGIAEVPYCG
jgi:hypothetical protein